MRIPLNEFINFRYIHINPATNHVHLLVPFIAGLEVSTDNTCKSDLELKAFFEGGAIKELESYKSTLEFHLSLLEAGDALYKTKRERLTQINTYLEAVGGMRSSYQESVNTFLSKPSNLYSIQLRPRVQDPVSSVVNPVFTINRGNDSQGTPLSPLYNKMHEVFPGLALGKPDPRTELIQNVLDVLPSNASFENIQDVLATQYGVPHDFFKKRTDAHRQEQAVDKAYVDGLMGFDEHATAREYIETLLGICAPNLQSTLQGSPFYFELSSVPSEKAERLSILTQFYLSYLNVYCRTKRISDKNFGVILDTSPNLSNALVELVAQTLNRGGDVEHAVIDFFNVHQGKDEFDLSRSLSAVGPENDKDAIVQKFETTYRTVTATKENPYMDDFMFLDSAARGEHDIFITNKGLICTDFANVAPAATLYQKYFATTRQAARTHRNLLAPQDEPVITIDIAPEVLIDKLNDEQWARLPKEVVAACHALPAFKIRELWYDVARGKQEEAHTILESSQDKQTLLRTAHTFNDYSGRAFHCTPYEYAYWAKDTHMQRMLERHMDEQTKAFVLEKIDTIERLGLIYQQHGVSYQNAHYDMSFILKNLTIGEFRQLQTMVGQNNSKIQQATVDNYKNTSFTATEYESLKKSLEQHQSKNPFSFFYSFLTTPLSEKLRFDFHSWITELDNYVNDFSKLNYHQRQEAWMKVGMAQRDVPAHVAHEYCGKTRFPSLDGENLPRALTFDNVMGTADKSWFPLSSSSGLGFDFALMRMLPGKGGCHAVQAHLGEGALARAICYGDWGRLCELDELRITDLTQSRENLSRTANQLGWVH
ncbi:hypothetical protein ACD661_11835 [Legionella lytica]|uniref:SidC N-terminal domain-containing protein n=1 Tax=Legionella lytica TaxID=96232 RepID=A0ABW8D968_9GAMM